MKNEDVIVTDRRCMPRIKTDLKINIPGQCDGNLVDINDRGVCFVLPDPIREKHLFLTLCLPARPTKIKVRMKWNSLTDTKG